MAEPGLRISTTTLGSAGTYTASVVSPASGDTGITLLEIYEINATAGSSPLTNLSNRLIVGTGSASATNGLIIGPGTGSRTLLLRAVGPTLGTAFGLSGVMANPTLSLNDVDRHRAGDQRRLGHPGRRRRRHRGPALRPRSPQSARLPACRRAARTPRSSPPLASGSYTMNVTGVGGSTGMALVEVYDITPSGPTTVSVVATSPSADTSGTNPGVFTISRTGDVSQPLTLAYTVGGTAVGGTDYTALPGVDTIPAGASTATAAVNPAPKLSAPPSTVIATLAASSGYGDQRRCRPPSPSPRSRRLSMLPASRAPAAPPPAARRPSFLRRTAPPPRSTSPSAA